MNLGNPVEKTIRELAEMVIALTNSKAEIEYRPLPEDDPLQRCPDISQAQKVLDWAPTVDVEVGMQRTVAYFQGIVAAPAHAAGE